MAVRVLLWIQKDWQKKPNTLAPRSLHLHLRPLYWQQNYLVIRHIMEKVYQYIDGGFVHEITSQKALSLHWVSFWWLQSIYYFLFLNKVMFRYPLSVLNTRKWNTFLNFPESREYVEHQFLCQSRNKMVWDGRDLVGHLVPNSSLWVGIMKIPNFILLVSHTKRWLLFHLYLVSPFPLRNSVDLQNYPEARVSCCRSLSFQYLYIFYYYILLLL